jgi:hypothetical protein
MMIKIKFDGDLLAGWYLNNLKKRLASEFVALLLFEFLEIQLTYL